MIAIVDYKVGNLGSIENMFKKAGAKALITSDSSEIESADGILLPGVGRFDFAMKALNASGLRSVLEKKAFQDKTPFLGICVGFQLMTKHSEEGDMEGLGWFDARVKKFSINDPALRVPHMGWNTVEAQKESPLFLAKALTKTLLPGESESKNDQKLPLEERFYFAHSYFVESAKPSEVLSTTEYGIDFHSALSNENIFGVQFHPEKSHSYGMRLLQQFAQFAGASS